MKLVMSYQHLLDLQKKLVIAQKKELVEILVDWETRNQYRVYNGEGEPCAMIVERKGSMWISLRRWFLRSHRPLEIDVLNQKGEGLLFFHRKFFFLFSHMHVEDERGSPLGSVRRRFAWFLFKEYDLEDRHGKVFAKIRSPLWRLWHFPLFNERGQKIGVINKKWRGLLRETFTDADNFELNFGDWNWGPQERAVILAAALSVDFDFFENNQGSGGIF